MLMPDAFILFTINSSIVRGNLIGSSINKSSKQSCTRYIRACIRDRPRSSAAEAARRNGSVGLTDYSDLLNLIEVWEEPRAGYIGRRFRGVASRWLVFVPTIDAAEILVDETATLTAPCSWHGAPTPKSRVQFTVVHRMLRSLTLPGRNRYGSERS